MKNNNNLPTTNTYNSSCCAVLFGFAMSYFEVLQLRPAIKKYASKKLRLGLRRKVRNSV